MELLTLPGAGAGTAPRDLPGRHSGGIVNRAGSRACAIRMLDSRGKRDYCSHMITNLRNAKARLSALVDSAAHGEEIVITVRGKPKARICPLASEAKQEHDKWARELREARSRYATAKSGTSGDIIEKLREDRT